MTRFQVAYPTSSSAILAGACLLLLSACQTVETTRGTVDVIHAASQQYGYEALAQIETERRRVREVRCSSPLLTPASVSAAASDERLGSPWVDDLLRECPAFAKFIDDVSERRRQEKAEALSASNVDGAQQKTIEPTNAQSPAQVK